MESFKPDCVISVVIHCRGKPAKYGYAVCLHDAHGKRIFAAAKFVGIGQRAEMELTAIQLGLEQARRLKQEKVELRLGPGLSADFLENRGHQRDEKLKLLSASIQGSYSGFRLRRCLSVPAEQLQDASRLAEKASSGIRNREDLV